MKPTPEEKRILEKMAPGQISSGGFLGGDRRPLDEIIETDTAAVEKRGLTHQRVADALDRAVREAMAAQGTSVPVAEHVSAVHHEAMGYVPSPWADGMFPKGEVEMTDQRTGEKLRVTPLAVHLIRAHGFYQGRGSRYRIEPEQVCRMFDLQGEHQA